MDSSPAPGHRKSRPATGESPPRSSVCYRPHPNPSSARREGMGGALHGGSRLDRSEGNGARGQITRARNRPDGEHVSLAANLDLVTRKRGKVEPGAQYRLFRNDQLAAIGLCQGFEAACGVDRVADRGNRDGAGLAHLADDRRPDMDSDADAQWLIELAA